MGTGAMGPVTGSAFTTDTERLFHSGHLSSSASPAGPSFQDFGGNSNASAPPQGNAHQLPESQSALSTLDEPVWDTILRDLKRISQNLVLVVFPFYSGRENQQAALRNWDLWGPMFFTLVLASCLSIGAPQPSSVFSTVFAIVSFGAVMLTVNVVLLGGNIGFFQSMCLLGYCLFPIDVAALVAVFVHISLVRWLVTAGAIVWACWASVPFIGGSVAPERRALAVYPLLLLYTSVGWLALIK